MIKAIIVDDELRFRSDIQKLVEKNFKDKIQVIGVAESVKDSIKLINKEKPDLLFLDIELTDGYSFEIFNNINSFDFKIIFITGFNHLAIKAIKLGALDYLLKPIDDDEFIEAVNKVIQTSTIKGIKEAVNVSSEHFKGNNNKRIVLRTTDSYYIVDEKDIIYCKSDSNYTTVYTKTKGNILLAKTLKKMEELLDKESFIKSHQSYLVNKSFITKMLTEGYLILEDKTKIPVSNRRKEYVIAKLS